MKERPILFSAPMVRALLAGTKTVTRRIMNPQPEHLQVHTWKGETLYDAEHRLWWWKTHSFENLIDFEDGRRDLAALCPYGVDGDRLWVKETFRVFGGAEYEYQKEKGSVIYRADPSATDGEGWKPSIFMPHWASRITLEVASVRVERLHEITDEQARAEGVPVGEMQPAIVNGEAGRVAFFSPRDAFAYLWAGINGAESWKANPWVWVLKFKSTADVERQVVEQLR